MSGLSEGQPRPHFHSHTRKKFSGRHYPAEERRLSITCLSLTTSLFCLYQIFFILFSFFIMLSLSISFLFLSLHFLVSLLLCLFIFVCLINQSVFCLFTLFILSNFLAVCFSLLYLSLWVCYSAFSLSVFIFVFLSVLGVCVCLSLSLFSLLSLFSNLSLLVSPYLTTHSPTSLYLSFLFASLPLTFPPFRTFQRTGTRSYHTPRPSNPSLPFPPSLTPSTRPHLHKPQAADEDKGATPVLLSRRAGGRWRRRDAA